MRRTWIVKRGTEGFEITEGICAGRRYDPGHIYEEIPAAEAARFDEVITQGSTPKRRRASTKQKKTAPRGQSQRDTK